MTRATVYIETHWIVGAVMGQDLAADELMESSAIALVLPSPCIMESLKSFEGKRRSRNELKGAIDREMREVGRSVGIGEAGALVSKLQEAKLHNDELLDRLYKRLDGTLARIVRTAESIHPTADDVVLACELALQTGHERADLLILALVDRHARTCAASPRAMLTGDGALSDIAQARFDSVGVQVFRQAKAVLGWTASVTGSDVQAVGGTESTP